MAKRLTLGDLNGMEALTKKEQSCIVGGSGCVWDSMAYAWDYYDDGYMSTDDEREKFSDLFQSGWRYQQNGNVLESGDPAVSQSGDLFEYISQFFYTTTEGGWGTSGWDDMISASRNTNQANGYSYSGMAMVVIGDELNQHAVIISGGQKNDGGNTKPYYECYDPATKTKDKVYVDQIRYGTGLSKKH